MEVVGTMHGVPISRLFNWEMEKTPSPEKEAEQQEAEQKQEAGASRVKLVLDLTDLDEELAALDEEEEESFADELEEIEARTAGAAAGLPRFKPDEDGRMMELVSHKYIRALMKSPPPSKPLGDYSIQAIRRTGITDEKELEAVARGFRALQSARDTENDIIRQFRTQGYAYVALPADDSNRYPAGPAAASGN